MKIRVESSHKADRVPGRPEKVQPHLEKYVLIQEFAANWLGLSSDWGSGRDQGMTSRVFGWLRIKDGVGLVETGVDGASRSVDVMVIDRLGDLGDIAALGLTLSQGKQLV